MHKELKRAIINWLFDNQNEFQIINRCTEEFAQYVYDKKGAYCIGGVEVRNFIHDAAKLIQN